MAVDVLLGLQWGDEGKGKVVDYLTPQYQVVARFQGGPNAGHTLVINGQKQVLHQIPSGIFHPQVTNLIGNGVVLNPSIFRQEVEGLEAKGLSPKKNLILANRAHLILPTHPLLDAAYEAQKGNNKIGSTLKGIGPTYQDKYARNGIRIGDVLSPHFRDKVRQTMAQHQHTLDFLQYKPENLEAATEQFFQDCELLKEFAIEDNEYLVNSYLREGKNILAEGAQGTLLDVEFGAYPFVTSSNTITAAACSGLGLPPTAINKVFGVFKAYCTRVGGGPFPTELFDDEGEHLRQNGKEFGSTTGRPRRTGWLDLPALRYAVMLNGVHELYMMKADVLNDFETLKVCNYYKKPDGLSTTQIPFDLGEANYQPNFRILPGWNSTLAPFRQYRDLPPALQNVAESIEEETNLPLRMISTGPGREETILRED